MSGPLRRREKTSSWNNQWRGFNTSSLSVEMERLLQVGAFALLADPVNVFAASAIGWGKIGKTVVVGELIVRETQHRVAL